MSGEIDWVQRRHECSVDLVFVRLRDQVEKDVAARNDLRQMRGETALNFRMDKDEDGFRVFVQGPKQFVGVKFVKSKDGISVQELSSGKHLFEGNLTLNEEGDCRLRVEGKELDFWQFRMKALQDMFF